MEFIFYCLIYFLGIKLDVSVKYINIVGDKMDVKTYFSNKLSKMLFLEIKREKVEQAFNLKVDSNIYLPIKSEDIISKVKAGDNLDNIPMSFFVEGMFFVLGADDKFRFNKVYEKIINNLPKSEDYIKGRIFQEVKKENFEDCYAFLKGLCKISSTEEVYDKLILVLEKLRIQDKMYMDEELNVLENAKSINGYNKPYLYEAIINREKGELKKALVSLNKYIEMGGKETSEVIAIKSSLEDVTDIEDGKELMVSNPTDALKKLLPLIDRFADDPIIYYYIGVAYRNLENYDKAIYYLNKSLEIDNSLMDVVNELAINYACIGNYDVAIKYLRKIFEAEKSIEVCTNLIMCYANKGDIEQVKNHIEIAKKIDPNDEVLNDIITQLNN